MSSSNSFKFLKMVWYPKVSCALKIKLAVHVEGLMEFEKFWCNMEGDGELSFLVADHLDKIYEVFPDSHDVHSMLFVSRLILATVQFAHDNEEHHRSSVLPPRLVRGIREVQG